LRLCARCSGYILGFTTPILLLDYFADPQVFLNPGVYQLACVLLALPYALDWVTQSWGLRQSSNPVRLATGVLMGVDVFLFSRIGLQSGRIIFAYLALSVAFIGYLGRLKRPNQLQCTKDF
jgi:uncharacterized membrane protein